MADTASDLGRSACNCAPATATAPDDGRAGIAGAGRLVLFSMAGEALRRSLDQ